MEGIKTKILKKNTVIVHERTSGEFPENKEKPYYFYNWFTKIESFYSSSKSFYDPPDYKEYIVRYIYKVINDIELIEWDENIQDEIKKMYPYFQGTICINDNIETKTLSYGEAAFLTQIMGFNGIDSDNFVILSKKVIDNDIVLTDKLVFNITEKEDLVDVVYGDEPLGIYEMRWDIDTCVEGKPYYTNSEIIKIRDYINDYT